MAVRDVLVELLIPALDGTYSPATAAGGKVGELTATPTRRHDAADSDGLVLPQSQTVKLDKAGKATLHLEVNNESWLWRIEEHVLRGRVRFINVPAYVGVEVPPPPLLYRELPDAHPGDDDPGATPAWWQALGTEITTRLAADTAEATTRAAADSSLDGRLDIVEATVPTLATIASLDALATIVGVEPTNRDAAITAAIDNLKGTAPGLLDTLGEISDALGDDPNFAATMTAALAGKQSAAALGADAAALVLAAGVLRDAVDARVTNGVSPEAATRAAADTAETAARIAADAALAASIATAVEDAVEAHTPGIELDYRERVTQFTHTQTAWNAASLVPGLVTPTIIGTGRPVDVEFTCQGAYHSVAGTLITAAIQCNDSIVLPQCGSRFHSSPVNNAGRGFTLRRRAVLADGVAYVFKAAAWGAAAGTTVLQASSSPIQLMVTSR